jgi:hypothetical protein
VLRAETIAPDGGLTAFADGIQIYNANAPPKSIRDKLEGQGDPLPPRPPPLAPAGSACQGRFREIRCKGDGNSPRSPATMSLAIHPQAIIWTAQDPARRVLRSCRPMAWARAWWAMDQAGRRRPRCVRRCGGVRWSRVLTPILPQVGAHRHADCWTTGATLHMATGLRSPARDRVMHRTTIKGRLWHGPVGAPAEGGQGRPRRRCSRPLDRR